MRIRPKGGGGAVAVQSRRIEAEIGDERHRVGSVGPTLRLRLGGDDAAASGPWVRRYG